MITSQHSAASAVIPRQGGRERLDDEETTGRSEVVGPVAIPDGIMSTLDAITGEAGSITPLEICATVLVGRLSPAVPRRAQVIRGDDATVTVPSTFPLETAISLRDALRLESEGERRKPLAPAPVDVTILVSGDDHRLFVESMTSSADAPSARSWATSFLQLLSGMAAHPDTPIDELPLVDDAERSRILHRLNDYHRPQIQHRTLTEPFEEQTGRKPDSIAVADEDGGTLTYQQLNEQANRLAHFLRDRGAGPGTRIGICLDRSLEQIVAIYAAVKTGATYVPLDPELPDGRIAFILEDSQPLHVLTDARCRERVPEGSWHIHDVDASEPSWSDCPTTTPVVGGSSGTLVHILYTSGTTGRPKGVAYPTDGVLAHLAWMQSRYPFGPGDVAIAKTSPGFDVSVWELFWPLYHGARLVICRPGTHRDPQHLANLVEAQGVTTIFLPPTVMTPFLGKVSPGHAGALRWALCGGEPVTPRIRDTFYATLPTATLVNCYGPTEAGSVTDFVLVPDPGAPVPLGRPSANFRIAVLDEKLEPVPLGTPGEAYIGGEIGLANAYWGAPGRTAERFVADPHGVPGARMYRTGDLCRFRDDGVLEHLGRIDRQLKIRGLRIEPGEIESVLGSHETVADCAVIAEGSPARLLAFVVPAGLTSVDDLDPAAIMEHASAILPEYMRPDAIIPVVRIPATVNGKIDKDALLRVWEAHEDLNREVVPPADELEAALLAIYERVLDTSPVSMLDTFTQLGGHSLLAFQLLDECGQTFSTKPDVAELLTGTLRDVATSLRAAQ